MSDAPRIGLTTYGRNDDGRFTLPAAYVEAVRRAGGLPILVAPGEPRIDEVLGMIDAVILTGGGDVDPARYGEARHSETYGVDPARDETDLALVRHVAESKMPALCICRGVQVLNVALGGTLIQHLPRSAVVHKEKGRYVLHPVRVAEGSRLAAILGTTTPSPASSHHQAIRDVAAGLEVVARAEDGVIEGVELKNHPWLFGVQWHPEHTAAEERSQQRLFDALVAEVKRRKACISAGGSR